MTATQWHTLEYTFASTAASLETGLQQQFPRKQQEKNAETLFFLPTLTFSMLSLVYSLCSAASRRRDTCKEQKSQLLPYPHQCCRQHLRSEPGSGWGPEDSCVCSLSLHYVCMHIVTFRQKVSSNSLRTHTELSRREKKQYERQISLATDRHVCQCCPQPQGDINYQTQVSSPKLWERAPGQMRASLGQWKEDIGLLMCNEA